MEIKTNVMRILDAVGVKYTQFSYPADATLTGAEIASIQGQNPECVFKTLVTVSRSNKHYVFMVPVMRELDLKRAAMAIGEKSLDMLKMRDLLPVTGYVHGGCSPVGMRKSFPTVIDASAKGLDTIIFSAGRVGHQIQIAVADLPKLFSYKFADICSGAGI